MRKRMTTDYGLEFIITDERDIVKKDMEQYDNMVLDTQKNRFGFYVLNTDLSPIDNEYDLDAIEGLVAR